MSFEKFTDLRISTMTVIVELSFFVRPQELATRLCEDANNVVLSEQTEMCKSQYRRLTYPAGTIVHVQYNTFWRGVRRVRQRARKKKNDFVNVVTVDVFTTNRRVNVMIFKNGKIKMAGCESTNDAVNIVRWLIDSTAPAEYSAVFSNEMINISFSFPYCINKMGINSVFNSLVDDHRYFSFYEQTGPQYVNLKVISDVRDRLCVVMSRRDGAYWLTVEARSFRHPPKTSFTIFDRRVIMSGVDKLAMRAVYAEFLRVIDDNKLSVRVHHSPPSSPIEPPPEYEWSSDVPRIRSQSPDQYPPTYEEAVRVHA